MYLESQLHIDLAERQEVMEQCIIDAPNTRYTDIASTRVN